MFQSTVRFTLLWIVALLLVLGLSQGTMAQPAGNDDGRLANLERRLEDLEAQLEAVGASGQEEATEDRWGFELHGWIDSLYRDNDKAGNKKAFDTQHLYLIFDANMNEHWRAFAEIEVEHAPDTEVSASAAGAANAGNKGVIKLPRQYIEYTRSGYHLRFGKFNTPLGLWTPLHYAILTETVQKPLHEDNQYVPNKQVGLEGFREIFLGDLALRPTVYLSNGQEVNGTNSPEDDRLGGGADLSLSWQDRFTAGASFHRMSLATSASAPGFETWDARMVYLDFKLPGRVSLRGEYFNQDRDVSRDVWTRYLAVKWEFIDHWQLYYRNDSGMDDKNDAGNLELAGHQIHNLALNWEPEPYLLLKLALSQHRLDNPAKDDYVAWDFFVGLRW